MATRIYFPSTGAADITPALGAWDETAGAGASLKSVTTKISSAMASVTVAKGTGATRALVRRYVLDSQLAAQTISAGTITGQIRALESAINDNLDLVSIRITVVSSDGGTLRGTILALGDYAAVLEFGTVLTNRTIADGDATTSVTAQAGDRLVIEIGIKNSTVGTSVSGDLSFGDNSGTDLAVDTTTTAANNPWIELSNTITFLAAGKAPRIKVVAGRKRSKRTGRVIQMAANQLAIPPVVRRKKTLTQVTAKKRRLRPGHTTRLAAYLLAIPAATEKRPSKTLTLVTAPKRRRRLPPATTQIAALLSMLPATRTRPPIKVVQPKKRRRRAGDATLLRAQRAAQAAPAIRPRKPVTVVTPRKRRKRAAELTLVTGARRATAPPPSVRPFRPIKVVAVKKRRAKAKQLQLLHPARATTPVTARRPAKPLTQTPTRKRRKRGGDTTLVIGARRATTAPPAMRPTRLLILVKPAKRRKRTGDITLVTGARRALVPVRPKSVTITLVQPNQRHKQQLRHLYLVTGARRAPSTETSALSGHLIVEPLLDGNIVISPLLDGSVVVQVLLDGNIVVEPRAA
ncbi:MAG: hypothetical protein M3P26_17220 [Gemmatimonadota bacterium]|nr:hypothetical protein [Gemmatimonadota bacterium]